MKVLEKFLLTDRVAVVTGAARGLGQAMAKALAEAGARVVVADIDGELAQQTAAAFRNHGLPAVALHIDVTQPEQVQHMVAWTLSEFGRLDILVNNAGTAVHADTVNMTLEQWHRVLDLDLTALFLCSQAAGREMIRQGKGSIINISSMSGLIVNNPPPQCSYYAAKGGAIMLTKSLAAEWAPLGVRVNCIAPGYMRTAIMVAKIEDPEWGGKWIAGTPMGRVGEPEELQGAVVYLASNASSFMTGQTLVIDGGFTLW